MSAFANITLQDNAATNVVFSPTSIDSAGVAKWLDGASVFDAKRYVTMSLALPKGGSSVIRIKQKIGIPIMSAVNAEVKVGEAYVNIEMVIPKLASSTTRLDLRKFADTLLTNAVTTAAVTSLEGIY